MLRIVLVAAVGLLATAASAEDGTASVKAGERLAIIGGCHDCHTVGYGESDGKVDPAAALKGNPVGYQGPWGTTYPANLRIIAGKQSEDEWVKYLKTFKARPPMPWFNVHQFTEAEMRSFYQYIKSLGAPGDPAPEYVPPGGKVTTPFAVLAPPTMPGPK